MECKLKGVNRIKLFVSGRKDFLFFDLPKNSRMENLKNIIAVMYNFDLKNINIYYNNVVIDDYKGKTIEQVSKGQELSLILIFKNFNNINNSISPDCKFIFKLNDSTEK
jgi:hypothetical protein